MSFGIFNSRKRQRRLPVYLLGFLLAIHVALPAYINSSFLADFVGEEKVGLVYAFAAFLTIISLTVISRFIDDFGNYRSFSIFILADISALFILGMTNNSIIAFLSFSLFYISSSFLAISLDLFLEKFSINNETGGIRGIFLVSTNLAWVFSPAVTGLLLDGKSNYTLIYIVSAFVLIPTFFIARKSFNGWADPIYKAPAFLKSIGEIGRNKNVFNIMIVSFLLQFFFIWMIIYTPIYLHNTVGIEWDELGIMFSIMLIPFILFQVPFGMLADKKFGEKEIMGLAFIVIGIFTAVLSFIKTDSFILWTSVLFMTRVGASAVEVLSESYFFKQISPKNVSIISIFRTMRPLAGVLAPILGSIILIFGNITTLFAVLSLIMFFGLRFSLSIKDSK